ncbi:hypothetical protein JHK82_039229 [Glycine max]|uniref:Uncharacterized protein n=2 Tax=Glycine subgen. Soja TaxID=1462606 RepID=K7M5Q9_SOYBN|nr:hypothetical protein GLYMA_14G089048v4 [Glycine max]KAG4953609.1 hypothetical protein JHK87_039203 [Glycine soja]KAG4962538.1 hypothetical protein JHK86_039406 [Glycine max]KAG4965010.1 hypothetical protein JHK85_039985 [Glycine max]KAG5110006.1 hypothetical protein JHK82_039229 [Glycine max]
MDPWNPISNVIESVDSMKDIVFSVLSSLQQAQQANFATIFWSIWRNRNESLWQGKNSTPYHIVFRGEHFLL